MTESQEAVDEETVEMLAVSEKLPSNIFRDSLGFIFGLQRVSARAKRMYGV